MTSGFESWSVKRSFSGSVPWVSFAAGGLGTEDRSTTLSSRG